MSKEHTLKVGQNFGDYYMKSSKLYDYIDHHCRFQFTVTNTENGIVLKGIEGTAWTDLGFSLSKNGKQAIDQFGMTKLN